MKYLTQLSYLRQAQRFSPNVCKFCYEKIGQFYHQVIFVNQCLGKGKRWITAGSARGQPRK